MKNYLRTGAVGAAFIALSVTAASAATVCSPVVAGKVSGTSACNVGGDPKDNPGATQVNLDEMFGPDDWTYLAKDDHDNGFGTQDEGPAGALTISGDSLSGDWEIDDLGYAEYMLVFKTGGGNADPENYVGYLLSASMGGYNTPHVNPQNSNPKDISHITLFGRGVPVAVAPLPAGGLLLLSGLGLLAMRKRRKT